MNIIRYILLGLVLVGSVYVTKRVNEASWKETITGWLCAIVIAGLVAIGVMLVIS